MTDYQELKRLAEAAHPEKHGFTGAWFTSNALYLNFGLSLENAHYIAAISPEVALSMIANNDDLKSALKETDGALDEYRTAYHKALAQNQALREALKAVIVDRDDMCFDKEKHVESEYGAYWSPSSSMVHSHVIAQARAVLTKTEGGV